MSVTTTTTTTRNRRAAPLQKTPPSTSSLLPKQSSKYNDGECDEFEFGGSLGSSLLILGFPLLMWYMWMGATYYDGQLPLPDADQTWGDFAHHLARLAYEGAYPTAKAWAVYWSFIVWQALMFVAPFTLS